MRCNCVARKRQTNFTAAGDRAWRTRPNDCAITMIAAVLKPQDVARRHHGDVKLRRKARGERGRRAAMAMLQESCARQNNAAPLPKRRRHCCQRPSASSGCRGKFSIRNRDAARCLPPRAQNSNHWHVDRGGSVREADEGGFANTGAPFAVLCTALPPRSECRRIGRLARGGRKSYPCSFAATSAILRPWYFAPASSLSLG